MDKLPTPDQIKQTTGYGWGLTNPQYKVWLARMLEAEPGHTGRRKNPAYKQSRHGCRVARQTVSQYFDLQPGHVVHHHDDDETNNAVNNLAVFASQSDHIRHHTAHQITPLWDGRNV